MTDAEDHLADRFQAAVKRAKSARTKLDRVLTRIAADANVKEPLIDLRMALDAVENLAAQMLP